ncbi:hypothetical protein D3C80_1777950 [compost metagenome]
MPTASAADDLVVVRQHRAAALDVKTANALEGDEFAHIHCEQGGRENPVQLIRDFSGLQTGVGLGGFSGFGLADGRFVEEAA